MSLAFPRIALIGKYPNAQGGTPPAVLSAVSKLLCNLGVQLTLERMTAEQSQLTQYPSLEMDALGAQCDAAIVIGGDGTMLGAARQLALSGKPLIGINQGRLGFITDIALDDYAQVLPPILSGEYQAEERTLIHVRVERNGACIHEARAMNDVVVNRGGNSGMVELRVCIDGHFVANHRADGLIVATPTGSTAYALSAGGPLLHPELGGFLMVPIAPHNLSNRPIALPDSAHIMIEIIAGKEISANFDMQSLPHLEHGDCLILTRAAQSVRLLHPIGWSYYDTLREKLHWNEHS